MVGEIVSRIIAFQNGFVFERYRAACSPRSAVSSDFIHFAVSGSSTDANPSKYARETVLNCTGVSYVPIFATAAARCTTALSLIGKDAWPDGPVAIISTFTGTFSLAATATNCTFPSFNSTWPPSFSENPQAILSQCFSTANFIPSSPPASSSASERKIRSRVNRIPDRFTAMNTARFAMVMPLSSIAPRP